MATTLITRNGTQIGGGKLFRAVAVAALFVAVAARATADQPTFASETEAAMTTMMAAMHVPSTGDPDRDFAAMMIPHHQGAIDMARAELRHGQNEQLRRLAQEIIVAQAQEIVVMRLAVGLRANTTGGSR